LEEIRVRVRGQIDADWSDRLGGLTIAHTDTGDTILTGSVRDQSALIGLMNRLSCLGLRLVSVASVETLSRMQGGQSHMKPQ
jgi:hypothetical protein